MPGGRVVVAGEALIDLVVSPDGGVTARSGGGPFNVARTAARLGVPAAFLGRLSTDAFGRRLHRELVGDGVDLSGVQATDDPTTLALAEVGTDGSATYRFYIAGTSAPGFDGAALPSDAVALQVGTLGLLLEPMATTIEALVAEARDDTLVALDVNARLGVVDDLGPWRARIRRIAARADVVKASRDDLRTLGMTPPELIGIGSAAVVVTDGAEAVQVFAAGTSATLPVPAADIADTIGAGDALTGGLLAWWCRRSLGRAATRDLDTVLAATGAAILVAAETCRRPGADPPRLADIANF